MSDGATPPFQLTPPVPQVESVHVSVRAVPSSTISVTDSPATKFVAFGVRLAPSVINCMLPLLGSTSNAAPSVIVNTSSMIVPIITGSVSVLLVSVFVEEMLGITTPSTANTPAALLEIVVSLAFPTSNVVTKPVVPVKLVNVPVVELTVVPVIVVPVKETKVPLVP